MKWQIDSWDWMGNFNRTWLALVGTLWIMQQWGKGIYGGLWGQLKLWKTPSAVSIVGYRHNNLPLSVYITTTNHLAKQDKGFFSSYFLDLFLADRFNKVSCLFCRNSIKCEMSSVKHKWLLSEVLLPIAIMDLIGNWKFKYSHTMICLLIW